MPLVLLILAVVCFLLFAASGWNGERYHRFGSPALGLGLTFLTMYFAISAHLV